MNLSDLFALQGLGVISTVSVDGTVNSAIYARPRVIDETTLVWGMTDRSTFRNVAATGRAAYLFKTDAPGFSGIRLTLELIRTEEDGPLLAEIKQSTDAIVGHGAGAAVSHAVWFRVTASKSLI